MLTRLLESKNLVLISGILASFIVLLVMQIGYPTDALQWMSLFVFIFGLGLNVYFLFKSPVLSYNFLGLFLMMVYVISFSGSVRDYHLSASFLFTSAVFYYLQLVEDQQKNVHHVLDIGIFLSFATLFFWPSSLFLVIAAFFLLVFTPFGLRALLLLLLGFLLPVALLGQLFYLFGDVSLWEYVVTPLSVNRIAWSSDLLYLTPFAFLLLLSLYDYYKNFNTIGAYRRFQYFFLGLFLLGWILILYFFMGDNTDWLVVLCLPISVFISRSLEFVEKRFAREILLWLVIASLMLYVFRERIPVEAILQWFGIS